MFYINYFLTECAIKKTVFVIKEVKSISILIHMLIFHMFTNTILQYRMFSCSKYSALFVRAQGKMSD